MEKQQFLDKLKKVKLLALDCDGIMAPLHIDTGVIMDFQNAIKYHNREYQYVVEIARFNHRDGQGIDILKKNGIHVVVVTTQRSGYVDARCFKLGIPCIKTKDKLAGLNAWLKGNQPEISMDEICYMGDEISDISVLRAVGAPATVADALPETKAVSLYVTKKNGGDGAVREVCDLILEAKKIRR
ncbi:MAG: HAD hydrolase family protein [Patescibacteria group bacterium]